MANKVTTRKEYYPFFGIYCFNEVLTVLEEFFFTVFDEFIALVIFMIKDAKVVPLLHVRLVSVVFQVFKKTRQLQHFLLFSSAMLLSLVSISALTRYPGLA